MRKLRQKSSLNSPSKNEQIQSRKVVKHNKGGINYIGGELANIVPVATLPIIDANRKRLGQNGIQND